MNLRFLTLSKMMSIVIAILFARLASADILTLNATSDSTIRESATNQSISQILFAGDTTNSNDFLRSVLAFNLNQPELVGATINSASLTMSVRGPDTTSASANMTVNLHALTAPFANADVTWTVREGANLWTTAGGDFDLAVLASIVGNPRTVTAGTQFNFASTDFTNTVSASNGSSLYLLLKSANEDNAARNLFQFASNENTLAAPGPVLTIDYTPAAAIPEPTSLMLLGVGAMGLVLRRRR